MKGLYKTIVIIWSEYDPSETVELSDLARDASTGEACCSKQETERVHEPAHDPDWDGTEFFDSVVE